MLDSQVGMTVNLSSTDDVLTQSCILLGFYINSTNAGTLVLKRGGSAGTALGGTITPAIGWHRYPAECPNGLHATIGGTALDVTLFVVPLEGT